MNAYESAATEEGLKKAFEEIGKDWKGRRVEVGVWNASVVSGSFSMLLSPSAKLKTRADTYSAAETKLQAVHRDDQRRV